VNDDDPSQPNEAVIKAITAPVSGALDRVKARLTAAAGALELGLPEMAHEEIEEIPPAFRTCEGVMRMRTMVFERMEAWELMCATAAHLAKNWPEKPEHWVWLAFATRRCKSVGEAASVLKQAVGLHPEEWVIPFNLACYASVTGDLKKAKELLGQAIEINPEVRAIALEDTDLNPLWDSLGETIE